MMKMKTLILRKKQLKMIHFTNLLDSDQHLYLIKLQNLPNLTLINLKSNQFKLTKLLKSLLTWIHEWVTVKIYINQWVQSQTLIVNPFMNLIFKIFLIMNLKKNIQQRKVKLRIPLKVKVLYLIANIIKIWISQKVVMLYFNQIKLQMRIILLK